MIDFRFANPEHLLWLLALPLLIALSFLSIKMVRARLEKFVAPERWPRLLTGPGPKGLNSEVILVLLACACFAAALARPQANPETEEQMGQSLDLMILLDVSRSMDAEDILPSRLKKAKHSINHLLDSLDGDRVGVVAFAGSAALISPLTSDYEIIRSLLQNVGTDLFSNQGTNFEAALSVASAALKRGGVNASPSAANPEIMLILSDGELTRGTLADAAKELKNKGTKIFSIGFGTQKGVPIPLRDSKGELTGYKKNAAGETVLSKLDPSALQTLAEAGGGTFYFDSASRSEIDQIVQSLRSYDRQDKKTVSTRVYKEYFWYPLALGIFLLSLCYIPLLSILSHKRKISLLLLFLIANPAQASFWRDQNYSESERAAELAAKGEFTEAEKILAELQANNPEAAELAYNIANIQAQQDPKKAVPTPKNLPNDLQSAARFNEASRLAKAGERDAALSAWADLAHNLGKQENRSAMQEQILSQSKKNIEILWQQDSEQNKNKKDEQKNKESEDKKDSKDQKESSQDSGDKKSEDKNDSKNSGDQKGKGDQSQDKNGDKKEDQSDQNSEDKSQNSPRNQPPRRHKFTERQDLSEGDAKRILESLKEQEGKLQKGFIKKQEKGKKFDYDENPDKDW